VPGIVTSVGLVASDAHSARIGPGWSGCSTPASSSLSPDPLGVALATPPPERDDDGGGGPDSDTR